MATIDPDFFDQAVDKAKANRCKNKDSVQKVIQVEPRLAMAIDAFINLRKVSGRSSIGMLRPSKKRKRPQRAPVEDLGMTFTKKRIKPN